MKFYWMVATFLLATQTWSLETQIAKAYDLKTKKHLYTIKMESTDPLHTNFFYSSPSGQKIGLKKFDFSSGCKFAPSLTMINLAYPQSSLLSWQGKDIVVKNDLDGKQSIKVYAKGCNMAWDVGIHRFFIHHWDKLQSGSISFTLLAFADDKALEFKAKMDSNYRVNLEPENSIVKMFVGEIWFQYDSHKNLIRYRGASDMKNTQGESPEVLVEYGPKKTD